jgi:ribose transport system substrate-binding protein
MNSAPRFLAAFVLAAGAVGAGAQPVPGRAHIAASAAPPLSPLQDPFLREAERRVLKAVARKKTWDGPTSGPKIRPGASIAFIAADLRNGGVAGVYEGVREAAAAAGWTVRIHDGAGTERGRAAAIARALAEQPAGLIFGGFDAREQAAMLSTATAAGLPVVGWHAAANAGPGDGLFTNIGTDPLDVAEVTAMVAIAQSNGTARVVIITDTRFAVAVAKSNRMAVTLRRCGRCEVLAIEDVSLDTVAQRMPGTTHALWQRFGTRWTHTLAINDLYFDHMGDTLRTLGGSAASLSNLSAGDGSTTAYKRIRSNGPQVGTVPEPLNLHGWQLIDEMNRALSGLPPSGYSAPVHFATAGTLAFDGGPSDRFDPGNGYREQYKKFWGR